MVALGVLWIGLAGCSKSDSAVADRDAGDSDAGAADASDGGLVGKRPYTMRVPTSYDAARPTPFVLLLHGYAASGGLQDLYFGFTAMAEEKGFLYAFADGKTDAKGNKFWNATDGCCNFDGNPVDDVAYLTAILDDVEARYNVDRKRVYIVGHSNGGFMAHRMACEIAPRVAAIVSLAGAQWVDATKCSAAEPVSVLQVHGDADQTIHYEGGSTSQGAYPSAHQTVATWAGKDHCTGAPTATGDMLDIDAKIAGSETTVEKYDGCPAGIDVVLWSMKAGVHQPSLQSTWASLLFGFLSNHPKP